MMFSVSKKEEQFTHVAERNLRIYLNDAKNRDDESNRITLLFFVVLDGQN